MQKSYREISAEIKNNTIVSFTADGIDVTIRKINPWQVDIETETENGMHDIENRVSIDKAANRFSNIELDDYVAR